MIEPDDFRQMRQWIDDERARRIAEVARDRRNRHLRIAAAAMICVTAAAALATLVYATLTGWP